MALLRSHNIAAALDLGSGGGFPGLPLAIAAPLERAVLVDSVRKKADFLRTAAAATGTDDRVGVSSSRAETLAGEPGHRARWPAVTARAVASMGELVELAFPLLEVGGRLIAWKRGEIGDELAAARRASDALGGGSIETHPVGVPDLVDHRIVIVRKAGPTPRGYPRDPAARRRSPW